MKTTNNLKRIRQGLGLKVDDVHSLTGIKTSALRQYEGGYRKPNLFVLKKLSDLYGVTINELYF